MVCPILPLFGIDYQNQLKNKPFLNLAKEAVIDTNLIQNIEDVLSLSKSANLTFSILVTGDTVYDETELVQLLNNGISKIYTDDPLNISCIPPSKVSSIPKRLRRVSDITEDMFISSIISNLKSDRDDKLYTTLVVDKYERCLGLVYSSDASISMAIKNQRGIYFSRSRNQIWEKGLSSGNTQRLLSIDIDCDCDALKFVVEQKGPGFCHLDTESCFGNFQYGLHSLEGTLLERKINPLDGSYTNRLLSDTELLNAKIQEEANELTDATKKADVAWEAADLLYFVMAKLISKDVALADVEANLAMKHLKITRRKGDAKPEFFKTDKPFSKPMNGKEQEAQSDADKSIFLNVINSTDVDDMKVALTRPIQETSEMMDLVTPIIESVRKNGDTALLELTKKFDGVELSQTVLESPFPEEYLEGLNKEMIEALDLSISNVEKFHAAQLQTEPLIVETQPGVTCSRFPRPIEKVGLYIPGGTAVLPSTALMLGVPAKVAGCKDIIFATPPRKSDGRISPEVVYVARKVGASKIVLAGGAQAIAAMAYGTESIPKVDKILGPGNQFVTAAKMYIQNDTQALCSIDMPAGPSEVLVVADESSDSDFVASDLLSQAEHGVDSQVILIGVQLTDSKITEIQKAVNEQANRLPREDIIRKCIAHSTIVRCSTYEEAFEISNAYAPEHLIIQVTDPEKYVESVDHAGSIFIGPYTPESCGDYASGTNHTLPTYGYARQYSGCNTSTFQKFITAQSITEEGLGKIGKAVMCVAKVEGLDGHRNAVKIRMEKLGLLSKSS